MQYQIYIDTLFINNLAINLFLLLLVSKMVRCTATHLSILLGAVMGSAAFCILIILGGIPGMIKILLSYGVIGLGMLRISLQIKDKHSLFRACVYFYGMIFLFGGILRFLFVRISVLKQVGITAVSVISIALFCTFLLLALIKKQIKEEKNIYYEVCLKAGDLETKVIAILDSGNLLYEPISQRPVSIVDASILDTYLEKELLKGFCVVPYHSIGKTNGILEGYEMEEIRIEGKGVQIKQNRAIVARAEESLASNGQYEMILHSKLMET